MKPIYRCAICHGKLQKTKWGWAHRSTKAKVLGHVPVAQSYLVQDAEESKR